MIKLLEIRAPASYPSWHHLTKIVTTFLQPARQIEIILVSDVSRQDDYVASLLQYLLYLEAKTAILLSEGSKLIELQDI